MSKKLEIPFIKTLEDVSGKALLDVLEADGALASVASVNWPDEYPYAPQCTAHIARSATSLGVSFTVRGMDLRAVALSDNGRSWEDSCCEVFLQPSPDGPYFNIEITCIGSILMASGSGRHERVQLPLEKVAQIKRYSTLEHKSYDLSGGDYGWSVAVLIPFGLIDINPENLPAQIRGNLYKCGDLTAHPHFLSWSPVGTPSPDFHRPEYFGELLIKL